MSQTTIWDAMGKRVAQSLAAEKAALILGRTLLAQGVRWPEVETAMACLLREAQATEPETRARILANMLNTIEAKIPQ